MKKKPTKPSRSYTVTFTPIPKRGCTVKELVEVRKTASPVLLQRRLKELTPAEFKLFTRLSKLKPSSARKIRGGTNRDDQIVWVTEEWKRMCESGGDWHSVTLAALADAFEERFGFRRHVSTLQRWLPCGVRGKPIAPPYIAPTNDPTFYWKRRNMSQRDLE